MKELILLSQKKIIVKLNNISINVCCYDNKLTYPVYLSDQKYEDCMEISSLIMCISKILTDLCLIRQKVRKENTFVDVVYSVLVVKMF